MESKIDRKNDEHLYQPQIHSQWIRELHRLKVVTGAPMTVLLDFAIREFIASYGAPGPISEVEEPVLQNLEQETWEEICDYRRLLDALDYQRCLLELEKITNETKE